MAGSGKPPRINFASWPTGGLRSQATAKVRRFFDFPGNSGCLRCPAHTSSFVLYARTNTSIEASFVDRIMRLVARHFTTSIDLRSPSLYHPFP